MTDSRATAILVAGMHRSGTSATAGALQLLGVQLGGQLLAAAPDNPKGYFENEAAVGIDERLMAALGQRWDDVRPLPAGWLDGDAARGAEAEIAALVDAEFAGTDLWAVKDPRLCRLLPLWTRALEARAIRPVVLIAVRSPSEVAASIHARNGWPLALGELLWLRHVAESVQASRNLPRAVISYDALLAAPEAAIRRALETLGVQVPAGPGAALDAFVDRGDRHHDCPADVASSGVFAPIAQRLHAALLDGDWTQAHAAADAFDAAWQREGGIVDGIAAMAARFWREREDARVEAARLASDLTAQLHWSEQAVATHGEVELERNWLKGALAEAEARERAVHERLEALRSEVVAVRDQYEVRLHGLREERDAHARELVETREAHARELLETREAHARELVEAREAHARELAETREAHARELAQERAAHARYVELIETSLSWRLTRPLRAAGAWWRSLRKGA